MKPAIAFLGLAASAWLLTPATAQAPELEMLSQLEKGQWEVRFRGDTKAAKICVRTGMELVQLRHAGLTCSRYTVEDSENQVAVHYTCNGKGYGTTSIRRETNRLVQIRGQGVAKDSPFQFTAEARRTGICR